MPVNATEIANLLTNADKNDQLLRDIRKAQLKVDAAVAELNALLAPDYVPAPKVPYIRKTKREQMEQETKPRGKAPMKEIALEI